MNINSKQCAVEEPVQELMGELSDALEILYSCRRLSVPVSARFIDYIDSLIDQLEDARPYSLPPVMNWD